MEWEGEPQQPSTRGRVIGIFVLVVVVVLVAGLVRDEPRERDGELAVSPNADPDTPDRILGREVDATTPPAPDEAVRRADGLRGHGKGGQVTHYDGDLIWKVNIDDAQQEAVFA